MNINYFKYIKTSINKLFGTILFYLIPNNKSAYNFSKLLINRYNNNRNFNPKTNGEFNLLLTFIKSKIDDKIFFDIGCNIGEFGEFLIKNKYDGKMFLFDPLDSIRNNDVKKYGIFTKKLFWDKEEKLNFFIDQNNMASGTNSIFDMNKIGYLPKSKSIILMTSTVDNYVYKNNIKKVDYVKIDAEGAEYRILLGMKKTLTNKMIKYIHLEFGHAAMADKRYIKDYYDYLVQFGYDMYIIKPKGIQRIEYTPYLENE
ncbi:FkbM family methyltransferase, partial [Candidatus Pelagibacter ubique]|nr:FkbM family methyltransferase [Candidatus Pelagibacter ubique]